MPISADFRQRLYPMLPAIVQTFATPFHIYDEQGIYQTGEQLKQAFSAIAFREFYAVKALPNPRILHIMKQLSFGFDCSSVAELRLARQVGAAPEDIMFTSNNTSSEDFAEALSQGGCIINLDDISLLDKIPSMPELICFRYNPGAAREGNSIIGNPEEAKYGMTRNQLLQAFSMAKQRGAQRFGLHTMLASNERDANYVIETVNMLLQVAAEIGDALSIQFEFINMGGGLGIPYRPEDNTFAIDKLAQETTRMIQQFAQKHGYQPQVCMESGRYITGPHGVLVTKAINRKQTYRTYIGVDACMSALMRPAMYGAYHHIEVLDKNIDSGSETVDVVGSLCENNDKFAVQRQLPIIEDGDLLVIQDTGAHGIAMGFNYNGKLRPQELLFTNENTVELIRRAETIDDYFATLTFASKTLCF